MLIKLQHFVQAVALALGGAGTALRSGKPAIANSSQIYDARWLMNASGTPAGAIYGVALSLG